jgi:hypothetical protein
MNENYKQKYRPLILKPSDSRVSSDTKVGRNFHLELYLKRLER